MYQYLHYYSNFRLSTLMPSYAYAFGKAKQALRKEAVAIIGATGIFFSACYSIYLYNRISYGAYSPHLKPLKDLNRREFILLITLLVPTIILGIFPNVVLETLHSSVT